MSEGNGNGISPVQKWRMDTEGRLSGLEKENEQQTKDIQEIKANMAQSFDEVKGLVAGVGETIKTHHEQQEKRFELGRGRMDRLAIRSWVTVGLSFVFVVAFAYHVWGMTVATASGGVGTVLGLIAGVKKVF